MNKNFSIKPDEFSNSPFFKLVPIVGDMSRLSSLTTALYVRYEKVVSIQKELQADQMSSDKDIQKRFSSEEVMLKHVLDWLTINPQKNNDK